MAKKRNWLEELQNIATQAIGPADTKPEVADEEINKAAVAKVNEVTALANQMYPQDANSRFDFWKSQMDIAELPTAAKNTYWKNYETMHPDGIDGATRDFVNVTKRELDMIPGMSQKEFFLRERVTQTPDWARKELEPLLAQVSTTVANANLNKAQQVYVSELDTRVNSFLSKVQLDPDVAIEDHVNDMMKLEQMNLLEMAQVKNGRVGFMKDGTQFVPAFGLQDSDQVLQNRAVTPSLGEQVLVREVGLQPIKNAVEFNVTKGRREIETQEETAKVVATRYLRDGKYTMDTWDKAFSMLPDMSMEDRVVMGLQGEMAAGRIKNEKQLAQAIYQSVNKYKNEFTISPGMLRAGQYMNIITKFEQMELKAYWDDNGKVWTIGKGNTRYLDGTAVKEGDTITKEQAIELAERWVQEKVIPSLEKKIPTWADMNQNQKDAIISFAYNAGENFYGREGYETITRALSKVENFKDVPAALALYKKSNGKVLNGLIKRRAAEAALFTKEPD